MLDWTKNKMLIMVYKDSSIRKIYFYFYFKILRKIPIVYKYFGHMNTSFSCAISGISFQRTFTLFNFFVCYLISKMALKYNFLSKRQTIYTAKLYSLILQCFFQKSNITEVIVLIVNYLLCTGQKKPSIGIFANPDISVH